MPWNVSLAGARGASFDKLGMRGFLRAAKISPHPELIEGRSALMQAEGGSA